MFFLKRPVTYGAIALTSLTLWGSYTKPNHAYQSELRASRPLIISTSSEHNMLEIVNSLPFIKKYLEHSLNSDRLVEVDLKNAVLADANFSEATITTIDLTRKNLEKINLRNIVMLEIVVVVLIIAYTYLRQP